MNMSDDFLKNISKTFRETMGTVGKKTDEFVEIQKIRSRQGQLESRIENNYQEIGRKIYCRYRNGEAFDEQLAEICREIMHMEKEIDMCKEQVAEKKRTDALPVLRRGSAEGSIFLYVLRSAASGEERREAGGRRLYGSAGRRLRAGR